MADLIDKARVIALVKEHLADGRRTYKGFGQAQEPLTFVESLLVPALAALPAQGVRVKPLVFSEFSEGGCMGRPYPFQYFITQGHNGRFLCHHDETWHDTLPAAQANAQADYQRAALAPAEAGGVEALEAVTADLMAKQTPLGLGVSEAQWQGLYEADPAPAPVDALVKAVREAALREAIEAMVAIGADRALTEETILALIPKDGEKP